MHPRLSALTIFSLYLCLVLGANYYDFPVAKIDLNAIFSNKRLLDVHIKCFLDKGKCPSSVKGMKKGLTEVMSTNCLKCNPEQKKVVKTSMLKLMQLRPESFAEIMAKYDPASKFTQSFVHWLKSP